MDSRAILPLIDMVFLTLGAILAAMTQMERVEALPVALAQVGPGAASVSQGEFMVLSVRADAMTLDGEAVTADQLPALCAGRQVIVRAERSLTTQVLLSVVAELARAGADVSLEVDEATPAPPGSAAEGATE